MSRNLDGVGVSLAFPARSIDAPPQKKKRIFVDDAAL